MKIIALLSRLAGYLATLALGLMMLLTVVDVFLRYFFNAPITGATEITEFMMVVVVFPAFAWCAINRRHVMVALLVSYFPPRVQNIIDTITLLMSLGIFAIFTWQSFLESLEVGTRSALLDLPYAPFYWVLTLGFALFCLAIAALIIENIVKEVKS